MLNPTEIQRRNWTSGESGSRISTAPDARGKTGRKSRFVASVEHGLHEEAVQAYLATTAYAEAQLGRVLDTLDKSPCRDDTIVVFLTDHSFHLGEKSHWQKAPL